MYVAKFMKVVVFTALIVAGSVGAPTQAQAAGGNGGDGGGGDIIVLDIVDSVVDEGSESNDTASSSQSDPDYKYIPVRR